MRVDESIQNTCKMRAPLLSLRHMKWEAILLSAKCHTSIKHEGQIKVVSATN